MRVSPKISRKYYKNFIRIRSTGGSGFLILTLKQKLQQSFYWINSVGFRFCFKIYKHFIFIYININEKCRNIHRGSPKMFRYDSMCYEIAQEILNDEEQKRLLTSLEFNFLLISLSHQENVEVIFRACEEYKRHLATLTDSPLSHYWKSRMRDCQSHADIV